MKKKVNYDGLDRPYMKTRKQGFGSIYGGNRNSNVNQETETFISKIGGRTITNTSTDED